MARKEKYELKREDTVIVSFPTYAGKLPNKILQSIKENLHANKAKTIAIVTFGNRSYDNSLAELVFILKNNGFNVIAAGAFVSKHPFSKKLGINRPNDEDELLMNKLVEGFINNNNDEIELKIPGNATANYYTPLKEDKTPANFLKTTPKTNKDKCTNCKACVNICPMQVIDKEDVSKTTGPCIKCHGCIYICKNKARYFDDPDLTSHIKMLEQNYQHPKKSEIFT